MENRPEKVFSTGAVQVSVWNNGIEKNGNSVSFKTIVLNRRYKDKEGNWKSTTAFRVNDIPKANLALQKAFEYLVLRETAEELDVTQEIVM